MDLEGLKSSSLDKFSYKNFLNTFQPFSVPKPYRLWGKCVKSSGVQLKYSGVQFSGV